MIETSSLQDQITVLTEKIDKLTEKIEQLETENRKNKTDMKNQSVAVDSHRTWIYEHNEFHEKRNWNAPYIR